MSNKQPKAAINHCHEIYNTPETESVHFTQCHHSIFHGNIHCMFHKELIVSMTDIGQLLCYGNRKVTHLSFN